MAGRGLLDRAKSVYFVPSYTFLSSLSVGRCSVRVTIQD